ncbi:hypothetical protein D3C86_651320 [compost metagenome]
MTCEITVPRAAGPTLLASTSPLTIESMYGVGLATPLSAASPDSSFTPHGVTHSANSASGLAARTLAASAAPSICANATPCCPTSSMPAPRSATSSAAKASRPSPSSCQTANTRRCRTDTACATSWRTSSA